MHSNPIKFTKVCNPIKYFLFPIVSDHFLKLQFHCSNWHQGRQCHLPLLYKSAAFSATYYVCYFCFISMPFTPSVGHNIFVSRGLEDLQSCRQLECLLFIETLILSQYHYIYTFFQIVRIREPTSTIFWLTASIPIKFVPERAKIPPLLCFFRPTSPLLTLMTLPLGNVARGKLRLAVDNVVIDSTLRKVA